MNLSTYIRQTAQLSSNSGGTVDLSAHLSMVSITWGDGYECFMQGHEADEFCDRVRALWEKSGDTTMEDCALCEAWPYIENSECEA